MLGVVQSISCCLLGRSLGCTASPALRHGTTTWGSPSRSANLAQNKIADHFLSMLPILSNIIPISGIWGAWWWASQDDSSRSRSTERAETQYTVPPNVWFGALLTHDIESFTDDGSVFVKTPGRDPDLHYSFVGVTCAPAYQFEDDEMATRDSMKALAPNTEAFINYLVPA